MTEHDSRPQDFDGLVVESPRGERILALPIAVVEALRYASVIQYRRAGRVHRMRVDGFTDGRIGGQPLPHVQDDVADAVRQAQEHAAEAAGAVASQATSSAPTPQYGAPAPPAHGATDPSPTPPPALEEDPADIPLRVRRGNQWVDIHVTRAQYETYLAQGRITQAPPADTEGTAQ